MSSQRYCKEKGLCILLFLIISSVFLMVVINENDIAKYSCSKKKGMKYPIACRDGVYEFNCHPKGMFIFNDENLIQRCKARPFLAEGHRQLTQLEAPYNQGQHLNSSYIKTKCNWVLPKLLSFYKIPPRPMKDNHKVPNLVHYVWFSHRRVFSYINYISFVSADKFLEPDRILLHGDVVPVGYWWNKLLNEIPNIYFVYRPRLETVQGLRPPYIEHEADITRLQVIYANGGIYLDTDMLILRSFDQLRNYELTLGEEGYGKYSNGVIISQIHSPFICVWLNSYREYPQGFRAWNTFSVRYPYLLSMMPTLRDHIHIEREKLTKPNWTESLKLLHRGYFDWSNNYAVHIWHRVEKEERELIPKSHEDILHGKNSLSDIIHYILKAKK